MFFRLLRSPRGEKIRTSRNRTANLQRHMILPGIRQSARALEARAGDATSFPTMGVNDTRKWKRLLPSFCPIQLPPERVDPGGAEDQNKKGDGVDA